MNYLIKATHHGKDYYFVGIRAMNEFPRVNFSEDPKRAKTFHDEDDAEEYISVRLSHSYCKAVEYPVSP